MKRKLSSLNSKRSASSQSITSKSSNVSFKPSSRFEKNYLKQVKKTLRFAIENEIIYQVEEILSSSKYLKKFKPIIEHNLPDKITNDYYTLLSNVSNTLTTQNRQIEKSSINNKKQKFINKIKWSKFYIDELERDNALHYACRLGKTCLIDILLDSGHFDVNDKNRSDEKDSPLGISCDCGWIDTAKILMSRGANLNYENSKAKTPLILSTELIEPYDIQMSKLLISNGALVNLTTRTGNTALLSASKYGNIELISLLIQANANINSQFNDGATSLMRACYYNYPNLVDYLLDNKANVEIKNLRKETALYIAAFRGHLEIVKKLVLDQKANVNSEDLDGDTPLSVACYEDRSKCVNFLLNQGALVNKQGIRGDTPLHIAVANCDLNVVQDLLNHGANPDSLNHDYETPLHIAIKHNRLQIVNVLLTVCKNLDQESISKKTALKCLIENLSVDKLRTAISMIKAGCDLNKSFYGCMLIDENRFNAQFDSPFEFIFKIPRLKFYNFISDEDQNETSLNQLINLIYLIIQSGYLIKQIDYKYLCNSWFYENLDATNRASLDLVFKLSLNQPIRLKNLCRIRIRQVLIKPLKNSILSLNHIPTELKSFLYFE